MDPAQPLLRAARLEVMIGAVRVCAALELSLAPGQCWALLGRNGVGKTTLLHTLAGLRPPRRGRIESLGQPLDTLGRRRTAQRIGLLLQDSDDPFPATVEETVLIGRHPHLGPWRFEGPEDHLQARQALQQVGLTDLRQRQVSTLSGGERRRVALATLLCQAPAVMLLDEPTNHLDLHHQIGALGLIADQVKAGSCALLSLHDVNLAARFCTHAVLLHGDGEVELGSVDQVLTAASLQRLYRHPMAETATDAGRLFVPM